MRGRLAIALSCLIVLCALPAAGSAATGDLTFGSCVGGGTGCSAVAGNVLGDAEGVAVSPNGKSLYVTGHSSISASASTPEEGTVSVLTLSGGGVPTWESCISNDGSGGDCARAQADGTPLIQAGAVTVSPNSSSLYVAANGDEIYGRHGDVVHLFANPATGGLSFDGCVSDDGSGGTCASANNDTLSYPDALAVSPNGRSLYVAGNTGQTDGDDAAVSHLFADATQGQLTYDGCVTDSGDGGLCLAVPGSGYEFATATGVAVSPNGASVYVSGQFGIDHLFADPTQGQLSWAGCVSMNAVDPCTIVTNPATPLSVLQGVAVNPSGTGVYVFADDTDGFESAVSHLFANPTQGQLSWDGCVNNDGSAGHCGDIPGTGTPLGGSTGFGARGQVAVSPDGKTLYVVTPSNDTVSWFTIASPDGQIAFQGCISDTAVAGCGTVPAGDLAGADGIAISPDGGSVYVTGAVNGTLVRFARDTGASTGTGTGTGTGSGTGTGTGGSGTGTMTPSGSRVSATIAGHTVTLSGSGSECVARTAPLHLALTDTVTSGAATFRGGSLYIDRGQKAVARHTVRRHGRRLVIKKTVYLANETIPSLPAKVSVRIAALTSGRHTVRVVLTYTQTRHHRTRHLVKTLRLAFRVC